MDTALSSPPFPAVPAVSPQAFSAALGRAGQPLVLDVRRAPAYAASGRSLAAAWYCAPEDVAALARSQAPRAVLVYCVYGHHVSETAAAQLRAAGWDARRVEGGIEGGEDGVDAAIDIARWRAARPLSVAKRLDLGVGGHAPSRWITRERPKIDRVACPWLVRRFIDPRAEFYYVPTPQVFGEAARLQAVAYDIPGAPISHDGDLCSFDALLRAFDLRHPALERLATIVRGADTDRLDLAPQSAGLLAASLGLSRLHSHDDAAMLGAALPLYDALYAWCQSLQDAAPETHSWKPETMTGAAS